MGVPRRSAYTRFVDQSDDDSSPGSSNPSSPQYQTNPYRFTSAYLHTPEDAKSLRSEWNLAQPQSPPLPPALAPVDEVEHDAQELSVGVDAEQAAPCLANDRDGDGEEAAGVAGSASGGGWGERRAQLLQLGAASWDRLVPRRVRRIVGQGIMPRAWGSQGPIFGLVDRQTTRASAWEWVLDTWRSRRMTRLDFLRHPLVRPVVELPSEAFVGLLFWTSLSAFVRSVYWFMLAAQGLTSHILLLAYLLVPGLVLGHEFLHQLLSTNPVLRALLVLGGVVGVGGSREGVETTIWGVALSGAGVAMVSLYVGEGLWLAPPARRRRLGFGLAGGLLLLQTLQLALGGRNPLLARWWGLLLLAVLPGAWVAALLLYEELRDWEGEEEEDGRGRGEGAQGYWAVGQQAQVLEAVTALSEDDWSVESEGGGGKAEDGWVKRAGYNEGDCNGVGGKCGGGECCVELVGGCKESVGSEGGEGSVVTVTVVGSQQETQQQQEQEQEEQHQLGQQQLLGKHLANAGSAWLGTASEPNSQAWGSINESHDASSTAYDRSQAASAAGASVAAAGGAAAAGAAAGPVWMADMLDGFMEEEEEEEVGGEGAAVVVIEGECDCIDGESGEVVEYCVQFYDALSTAQEGVAAETGEGAAAQAEAAAAAAATAAPAAAAGGDGAVPQQLAAQHKFSTRPLNGEQAGGCCSKSEQGGCCSKSEQGAASNHKAAEQQRNCRSEGEREGECLPAWREPERGVLEYFGLEVVGSVETSEDKLRAEWRSSRQWETAVELSEFDTMGYGNEGPAGGFGEGKGGGGGVGGDGDMGTGDGWAEGGIGLCRVRSREKRSGAGYTGTTNPGASRTSCLTPNQGWKRALPWEGQWESSRTEEEMLPFRQKRLHWTKHGCLRTCQTAIGHGSLIFLSHWLLSSPYLIPRWLAAPPAWGFVTIVSLALGIVLAAEVLRMHIPKRVHAIVALTLAISGCLWLLLSGPFHPVPALQARPEPGSRFWLSFYQASGYVPDQPHDLPEFAGPVAIPTASTSPPVNGSSVSEPAAAAATTVAAAEASGFQTYLLGAPLLALAIPSLWVVLAQNMGGAYPGLGAAGSAIWYVILLVWSAALVAYEKLGPLGLLRGSLPVLMAVAMGGVAWGVWRAPEPKGEGRRGDLAVRTEWWRLGRLAWGSGVPDRMAVAALLLLVVVLLPFPLLLQYAYAPSSSPTFVSNFGPHSPGAEPDGEAWVQLRVLNFNVQQGFSRSGSVNMDAIEHVIWQQKPDIVLLQESDTMHLIHGNVDMVQYLATWLGMYSWSAPPARHQSWGCAILSRFPLLSSSTTHYLPSPHGELACFQHALILLGARGNQNSGGNQLSSGTHMGTGVGAYGYPVHIMNAHFSDLEVDIRLEAERAASLVRGVLEPGRDRKEVGDGVGEGRRTQEEVFPAGVTPGEISGDFTAGGTSGAAALPSTDAANAPATGAAGDGAAEAEGEAAAGEAAAGDAAAEAGGAEAAEASAAAPTAAPLGATAAAEAEQVTGSNPTGAYLPRIEPSEEAQAAATTTNLLPNSSPAPPSTASPTPSPTPSPAPALLPAPSSSPSLPPIPLIFGGDFNTAPLSPPYLTLLSPGIVDSQAEKQGAWKSTGDRDPGAGYVLVSRGNVECLEWREPRYDQRKTSDGYPVVVDVRVKFPGAGL